MCRLTSVHLQQFNILTYEAGLKQLCLLVMTQLKSGKVSQLIRLNFVLLNHLQSVSYALIQTQIYCMQLHAKQWSSGVQCVEFIF